MDYFTERFELVTGQHVADYFNKTAVAFISAEKRNGLLRLLKVLYAEGDSGLSKRYSAEAVIDVLIKSVHTDCKPRSLKYCNQIAHRAHELIIATPEERLSLTDICKRLNVASRSLQQGFTELYGMGVTDYHQLYRLHALRVHIKRYGIKRGALDPLMRLYGFNHKGRLSQYYKETFGVLPSQDNRILSAGTLSSLRGEGVV